MTAEATRAPDKRLQAGAVPATATNSTGCFYCDRGDKPIKLRRQYIHHRNHRIVICENRNSA